MSYITNLPVNNTFNVTAYFGQENPQLWKNGHKGIDVTGEITLYSVCEGTVTYQGYDSGWGYYVSVMPEGFERIRFILCHMVKGSIKVKKGDYVKRTTVLGKMGTTGNSTGVHTHIECRIDNTAVDPTPYLKIENKKAMGLNSVDYKTTVEESDKILQEMLNQFDNKVASSESAKYKSLYESEKVKTTELTSKLGKCEAQISELTNKINKIKEVLK